MSPEQASGKPVDKRSDVWSFGVVLWEMLSGKRLFEAETISHTLADVLRSPIEFDMLPAALQHGHRMENGSSPAASTPKGRDSSRLLWMAANPCVWLWAPPSIRFGRRMGRSSRMPERTAAEASP